MHNYFEDHAADSTGAQVLAICVGSLKSIAEHYHNSVQEFYVQIISNSKTSGDIHLSLFY